VIEEKAEPAAIIPRGGLSPFRDGRQKLTHPSKM